MAEFLLSKLNIHVSGGCGPKREEPIACFRPIHQSYNSKSLRTVATSATSSERAVVRDRDVEKAFESALGQETMFVAIEAFLDGVSEYHGDSELVQCFGEYVETLGTQPVTVTISSLIEDMLDSYANVTRGLSGGFSWNQDLLTLAHEFICTRECFLYTENRAPNLEVTFNILHSHGNEIDVELCFNWQPPLLDFCDLRNEAYEGTEYSLKPKFHSRPYNSVLKVTAEYYIGSDHGWLQWDGDCFKGVVPSKFAAQTGSGRLDIYNTTLELTARITQHFPGAMRFERVFRCEMPLRVKRVPDRCYSRGERFVTPSVSPTGCLARPPLLRSPLKRSNLQARTPCTPMVPRTHILSRLDKENNDCSLEDVHKLMQRKAEIPKPHSPVRLDSLSLARLHDATSNPPPSLTDVEIRTVHVTRPNSSERQHCSSQPLRRACRLESGRIEATAADVANKHDLSQIETRSSSPKTPIPAENSLLQRDSPVASQSKSAKSPKDSPNVACYSCSIHGRDSRVAAENDSFALCTSCQEASMHHRVGNVLEQGRLEEKTKLIDQWQGAIQRNFKEFEDKEKTTEDRLDITMEDVVDSEEELPSFQTDV